MRAFKLMPMGAVLFALGLGLCSFAPAPARAADDEDSGTRTERKIIRITPEDGQSDAGYLGVQVQRLTASLRRAKGIPESAEGTLVSTVEEGSPADAGGIRRGDVILEVSRESTPNPNVLVQVVRGLEPGRRVPVLVWRDGVTRTVNLKVGARPEGSDSPAPPRMPGWEGRQNPRGFPDDEHSIILRGNRDDLERQIKELQEQLRLRSEELARLEREVRELRSDLRKQMDRRDRDRDEDRRGDDGDRDLNEED